MIEKVYAQTAVSTSLVDPASRFTNLGNLFGFAINLVIGIGWALVFVMLALGFVQYVMSKGEKTAVDNAQKWLTYAVLGGVGLFFISFVRRVLPNMIGTSSLDTGGDITNF
jgi:hypothetical protein